MNLKRDFETSVLSFCKKYDISHSSNIIVAFSGGSDSLSLLICLKSLGFVNLTALYVNHHLRSSEELQKEIELNQSNADLLKVKFVQQDIDTVLLNTLCKEQGEEGAARTLRYEILKKYAQARNINIIMTGHNRTDCDEDDIISFFRGGSIDGINERIDNIIYRPLLWATHEQTAEYCKMMGYDFSTDSTNADNIHLRSRIRQTLNPVLSQVFPSFSNALQNRRTLSKTLEDSNGLLKSDLYTSLRLVNAKESNAGRVSLKDVSKILDFVNIQDAKSSINYCDAVIFKQKGSVVIANKNSSVFFKPFSIKIDLLSKLPTTELPNSAKLVLSSLENKLSLNKIHNLPPSVIALDSSTYPNIIIRSAKEGDKIVIQGKEKKVFDIFKSCQINKNLQNQAPVIESKGEVVGVLLGFVGQKNKFKDNFIQSADKLLIISSTVLF